MDMDVRNQIDRAGICPPGSRRRVGGARTALARPGERGGARTAPAWRGRLAAALGAMLLLAAAACAPAAPPAPAPKQAPGAQPAAAPKTVELKVGVVGGVLSPLLAGINLGIFEKDGLKIEMLQHRGGAEAAQAMVGGGVQIFLGDFSHAIRLNQQGQQIRVIAGVTERFGYTLMGAPGTKTGLETLKGQKIGITSPGSQTDNALRWLAKSNGWNPDKDFELVAIGVGAPMMAAVQNKQVHAGMVNEPFTSQLKTQNFAVVYDLVEAVGPFEGTVYMAKQSWVKENEETVRRFLKSFLGVVNLLYDDDKVRNEFARKTFPDLDPKVADAAALWLIKTHSRDGSVSEAAIKKVFEFEAAAAAQGAPEGPKPAFAQFSDLSYLPKK